MLKTIHYCQLKILRDINVFWLEKENKVIKDRIIRDISDLSEHEEEDHYKSVIVSNLRSNNHIKYKSKGNRKILSVEEYLNKIRPYLKGIINNLKKSDTGKFN